MKTLEIRFLLRLAPVTTATPLALAGTVRAEEREETCEALFVDNAEEISFAENPPGAVVSITNGTCASSRCV